MELKTLFGGMKSGDFVFHTELGIRDEKKQVRTFNARYSKQKLAVGINNRILVLKDLVVPLNPMTGKSDKDYNSDSPFRPILLVSDVITLIKMACKDNPNVAEEWTKQLGGALDLSKEEATLEDYYLFKKKGWIKPRITTHFTVSIKLPKSISNSEFRQKFVVPADGLNSELSYDPINSPLWHQGAVFFNSLLRPEWDEKRKMLEANNADMETISAEKSKIFVKSPIGFVKPTNFVPYVAFPIDSVPSVTEDSFMDVEKYITYRGYDDQWSTPLNEVQTNDTLDTCIDFYDFNLKTPQKDARRSDGKVYTDNDTLAIYQATTITVTDGRVALQGGKIKGADGSMVEVSQAFQPMYDAIRAYFRYSQEESTKPNGDTFEKIMAASNRMRPILSIQDKLLAAFKQVYEMSFADSKYNDDTFKAANSKFLSMLDPKYALEIAAMDEDDIQKAEDQQKSLVSEIIKDSRESEDVNNIDLDTPDIEIM